MDQYLRIASPGIADPTSLTVLGVGSSRYSENPSVIGQFASGAKLAAGLLLRNGLPPVITLGRLKMTYGTKPIVAEGRDFSQVTVKFSGQDPRTGKNRTSTEDLGYTLEWGVADWNDVTMAPREYLANAIDSVTKQGLDVSAIEVGIAYDIRAKADWTQVYIPLSADVLRFFEELESRFLHFGRREYLDRRTLPKVTPDEKTTRIYKKGVLVASLPYPSVWDYNLGDELRLDESRNASEWDVKYAVAKALSKGDRATLARVIKMVATGEDRDELLEAKLSADYLYDEYLDPEVAKNRKGEWKAAFRSVAGETGVACSGLPGVASHIEAKGLTPFTVPTNWLKALDRMGVDTEDKVLSKSEKAGEVLSEPTEDMIAAVMDVWDLLEREGLTNGKDIPPIQGFKTVMTAGTQKMGEYRDGTVLLHTDLSTMSPLLRKVALEEVVHHVTGAGDMSRDLQDFLFRLVTQMAWKE